jgi:hypothetical protein
MTSHTGGVSPGTDEGAMTIRIPSPTIASATSIFPPLAPVSSPALNGTSQEHSLRGVNQPMPERDRLRPCSTERLVHPADLLAGPRPVWRPQMGHFTRKYATAKIAMVVAITTATRSTLSNFISRAPLDVEAIRPNQTKT